MVVVARHRVQGWKLQAVCLSGPGKNRVGQVKILDTLLKERLKFWKLQSVCLSRTGKNRAGQVNFFNAFPNERLRYFVTSTPGVMRFQWFTRYRQIKVDDVVFYQHILWWCTM